MEIANELMRALEIVQTYTGEEYDRNVRSADRGALVGLLDIVGEQHAYIRTRAFHDVVMTAYQMGWQDGFTVRLTREGASRGITAPRSDDTMHD